MDIHYNNARDPMTTQPMSWPHSLSKLGAVLGLTTTLSLASGLAYAQQEPEFRWRMQRYTGPETAELFETFAQQVKQASDGRLEITLFSGGELVPNEQLLAATGGGLIEMAYGHGAYWAGNFDLGRIEAGLPLAWTSLDDVRYLWGELGFGDMLDEAYAERGVHYLTPVFGGPYELLSKEPVESLDDMREIKIRATSTLAEVLDPLGVPTVYLPPEELYVAMSTNAIGGVIYGGAFDYELLKLQETAEHYTELGLLYPGYVDNLLVNQRAWDQLPEDLKTVVSLAARDLARRHHDWFEAGTRNTLQKDFFVQHSLPDEDVKQLTESAQALWDEEAARSDRNAKAIEMLRDMATTSGRLQ